MLNKPKVIDRFYLFAGKRQIGVKMGHLTKTLLK